MTSIQTCLPCKHGSLKMAPSPSLLRHGSANARRNGANRRSAVERLEESKANYVKSESVLDSKQEFEHSMHLQVGKLASDLSLLKPNWNEVVLRPKSPALPIRARAKSQSEVRDSPTRRRISLFRRNSARSVEGTTDLESQLKQLISADELPHPRLLPPPHSASTENNQKVRRGYSDPVNRHGHHHGGHRHASSSLQGGIHKSMPDLSRRRPPADPRTLSPSSSSSSDSSEDFFRVTPKNSLRCLPKQPPNHRRGGAGSDTSDDEALRPPPPRPVYVQPAPPPPPLALDCYSLRRPVLRSKSDVGYRSLVRKSPADGSQQTRRRNSYSGSDLERFFNMLGLDSSVWHRLTSPAAAEGGGGSPPRFFESGSSIQSDDYRSSFGSDDSMHREGLLNRQLKEHSPGETSIVEKNARVIKWLYNCRKAQGVLGT